MIIIDQALKSLFDNRKPIRVGMIGAGFMGKGIALQICNFVQGMELSVIFARRIDSAKSAYSQAGIHNTTAVETVGQMEDAIAGGKYCVTDDPLLLCQAESIDVLIEVTGSVDFASNVIYTAIENHKHLVMMNAEVDGTVGPILKVYADKAGVVLTGADGDQPGVIMNLYRFVKNLGVKPVLCGNIKGLHDPYRNPTTQKGFAEKWGQNPAMVTSFADGTKISFEQAIVANATGMRVGKQGMYGPTVTAGTSIKEVMGLYPLSAMTNGPGIVDYVVGAEPSPGVFVLGTHDDPIQKHYLNLYKLGEGPLYCFYTPYHLCHFEVPNAVARAVLFHDAAIAPLAGPCVDVVTAAKTDLKAGQTIDGLGHYMTYGLCENAEAVYSNQLLPIGLAEGCRLKRDIQKDQLISYSDVKLPENRLCDKLRQEQNAFFYPDEAVLKSRIHAG